MSLAASFSLKVMRYGSTLMFLVYSVLQLCLKAGRDAEPLFIYYFPRHLYTDGILIILR